MDMTLVFVGIFKRQNAGLSFEQLSVGKLCTFDTSFYLITRYIMLIIKNYMDGLQKSDHIGAL